ncbi:MAG TPA: extracellular solute-binding protein [Thermomicrobiales bacterium]|nr:extracellular solute-binding protein [Thermomicrobiales bacterium]
MSLNRRQLMTAGAGSALALTVPGVYRFRSAVAQETTVIRWWHITTNEDQAAQMQAAADAFVEANPDVEIEITVQENEAFKARLTTVMQSGDPPDVFQSWGGGVLYQYAEAGLVRDLTDALAADGWGESFAQSGLALYGTGGRNYGVPWNIGMVGFWYSKAKFAEAGIEAVPATWADLLTTVQALKDAGIVPIALGGGDKWPIHFYWVYLAIRNGGQAAFDAAYTREGSFADPPFVKAGADLLELSTLEPFQEGYLAATWPDSGVVYANGGAAMMLMGHWFPSGALDANLEDPAAMREDLGWFPFPSVDGGAGEPNDVLGGGNGFAVGANAPDAAVEFVKYLTSAEVQTEWAATGFAAPPAVVAANSAVTDPNLLPVMDYLAEAGYFQLYYDQFLPPAVGGVVNDESQALIAGAQTPEGMAESIEASFAMESGG